VGSWKKVIERVRWWNTRKKGGNVPKILDTGWRLQTASAWGGRNRRKRLNARDHHELDRERESKGE